MCSFAGSVIAAEIILEAVVGIAVFGWFIWLGVRGLMEDRRKKNDR